MINFLLLLVLAAAVAYLAVRVHQLEKQLRTSAPSFDAQRVYRIANDTVREHEKEFH